jgi:N-acetyl-anhydromuramyl-L-alanine amidase AmpD
MSFVWKAPRRLKTPEQCAAEMLGVAKARGLNDFAAVLATMCVAQESDFWCPWNAEDPTSHNYAFDSESNDGRSVAYFQQQNKVAGENPTGPGENWWGPMASRMDLKRSCDEFLSRLSDDYMSGMGNPARSSELIANVQRCREDLRGEYAKHYDKAVRLVGQAAKPGGGMPVVVDNRPDFNEYEMYSENCQPRGGTRVDLFLLHTQEGPGNADSLAKWMQGQQVSYHYTISMDPGDKGVTVVDVVDTDLASWSVLSANNRSINLCFAGSYAKWTRQEWINNAGRAIDVAAYLAAADCKKYGISTRVVPPPYRVAPPGVSDHRYVTQFLKDGTHTDVGDGFPWDAFTKAFDGYVGTAQPAPVVAPPLGLSDRKLLEDIWEQLRGDDGQGWKQLGQNEKGENLTLVDAVAELLRRTGS